MTCVKKLPKTLHILLNMVTLAQLCWVLHLALRQKVLLYWFSSGWASFLHFGNARSEEILFRLRHSSLLLRCDSDPATAARSTARRSRRSRCRTTLISQLTFRLFFSDSCSRQSLTYKFHSRVGLFSVSFHLLSAFQTNLKAELIL